MTYQYYRERWTFLIKKNINKNDLKRLSRQIAHSFLDYYLKDCHYETDYIDLLCEMATFSNDPELNFPGSQAFFSIIESLCDDFEELQTLTYNKVMSQTITYCRKLPSGKSIEDALNFFGLYSSQDLLDRINKIRTNTIYLPCRKKISKIIILSRVTIGADVAITSVIIQRVTNIFPDAEIVLIGSSKLEEIYGSNPNIKIVKISYSKNKDLLSRLLVWLKVLEIIKSETVLYPVENTILIDPDSRLSQLGILPLFPLQNYYFFDSRSDSSLASNKSMSEMTNSWIDKIAGNKSFCYPALWIRKLFQKRAEKFCRNLKTAGAKKIICVNFGVGNNHRKKISRNFEEKLLLTLLKEQQTVIILDKGFGEKEVADTNLIVNSIKKQGYKVKNFDFKLKQDNETSYPIVNHGIIGIQCKIGEIAALISNCDEFVGYDSACQHISAALQTQCITIFAGSNNMRFIRRWSSFGKGKSSIIHVDTLNDPDSVDAEDIIDRVINIRRIK